MTKNSKARYLTLLALMVPISQAQAQTVASNLSVSATVVPNCTISTGALSFPGYDPVVSNANIPLIASTILTLGCTRDAPATIMLGQGVNTAPGSTNAAPMRRLSGGGANPAYLTYSLYQDNGYTTRWTNSPSGGVTYVGRGAAGALTVYGKVDPGQNVPAGTYSDMVTATISF